MGKGKVKWKSNVKVKVNKIVPLNAMQAPRGRGTVAPTYS
jgi:hypothetical protein